MRLGGNHRSSPVSQQESFYVYIMANQQRTIYIGMTNDLERRVWEYKHPANGDRSFTARYRLSNLVYAEEFDSPGDAIAREKTIKGWKRPRKLELVNAQNPAWNDLAANWYSPVTGARHGDAD